MTTRQQNASHCAGLGVSEILSRMCVKIATSNHLISIEEIPKIFRKIYVWYLDRMAYDTKISDEESISFDWLSIFVHELNYGFGEIEFHKDDNYVIIKTITDEPVLPYFHFLTYENTVPHFPESETPLTIYSLMSRIQRKLASKRQQININVLYPTEIPKNVNAVNFLIEFMGSHECCIDITFDEANDVKLMYPDKKTGIIQFDPKTMSSYVSDSDVVIYAHTMMVHHVEEIGGIKYLALTNTWSDWGHKTVSKKTGRSIEVGYFALSDEIVRSFLNSIFYLSINVRSVIIEGPKGESYELSVGGRTRRRRRRRTKVGRRRPSKSNRRRRTRAKRH